MTKKTKMLAGIAAAALLVLVGAGLARCAAAGGKEDVAVQEQAQAEDGRQEESQGDEALQEGGAEAAEPEGFSAYANTSWASDDGTHTLDVIEGALIVREDEASKVVYYREGDAQESGATRTFALFLSESPTAPEHEAVCAVTETASASTQLVLDELEGSPYTLVAPAESTLALAGTDGRLAVALGVSEDEVLAAVSAFAAARSPYAQSASWDKEVWIDYNASTALTTFTLDDAAATIVTVTVGADGKPVAR